MGSKYRQLAEILESKIASGEYAPESYLPSERLLCEHFDMSRMTVRNGLNVLVDKHLVVPSSGKGYQVVGRRRYVSRKRTRLIGGVFAGPQTSSPTMYVPYELSHGIGSMLEARDYNLVISNSGDELLREREGVKRLLKRGVDGLLVMPALTGGGWSDLQNDPGNYQWFRELADEGLPVVLIDRQLAGEGLPGVYSDHSGIGRGQVEHMVERGFRRIIRFTHGCGRIGQLHTEGYLEGIRKYGLEPLYVTPSDFESARDWSMPSPRHEEEIAAILPHLTEDTALVVSPFLAPALDKFFPEHQYRGKRVEWISSDFTAAMLPVACQPYPCLIRPVRAIGEAGAEKLLRLLDGDLSAATVEWLESELTQ